MIPLLVVLRLFGQVGQALIEIFSCCVERFDDLGE
jgi:hypothetical protein